MKGKKGIIFTAAITAGLVLAIAVLVIVVVGGFGVVTWILAHNVFTLIGVFLLVIIGIGYIRGVKNPAMNYLLALGVIFVFIPMVTDFIGPLNIYQAGSDTSCISSVEQAQQVALEREATSGDACLVTGLPMRRGSMPTCADSNIMGNQQQNYLVWCSPGAYDFISAEGIDDNKCQSISDCRELEGKQLEHGLAQLNINAAYSRLQCVEGRCKSFYEGEFVEDMPTGEVVAEPIPEPEPEPMPGEPVEEPSFWDKIVAFLRSIFGNVTLFQIK